MGQLFNLPLSFCRPTLHERFDLLGLTPFMRMNWRRVQVGVNEGRRRVAGGPPPTLRHQPQPHAPRPCCGKARWRSGPRSSSARSEFIDEARLFQKTQRFVVGNTQQGHDPRHFVCAIGQGHALEAQFAGAAVALEPIEQHAHRPHLHSFERFRCRWATSPKSLSSRPGFFIRKPS